MIWGHPIITPSTMIAQVNFGRKVRCHIGAVEILWLGWWIKRPLVNSGYRQIRRPEVSYFCAGSTNSPVQERHLFAGLF
jgi:hypothetical protein